MGTRERVGGEIEGDRLTEKEWGEKEVEKIEGRGGGDKEEKDSCRKGGKGSERGGERVSPRSFLAGPHLFLSITFIVLEGLIICITLHMKQPWDSYEPFCSF